MPSMTYEAIMFGYNTVLWFAVFLILLLTKHFVIDYVCQNKYLTRRASKRDWLMPLVSHSGAHGAATLVFLFLPGYIIHKLWLVAVLALLDALSHLAIDLTRSRLFHYNVFQPKYWTIHGLDQLLHHITYVLIAGYLCYDSLV